MVSVLYCQSANKAAVVQAACPWGMQALTQRRAVLARVLAVQALGSNSAPRALAVLLTLLRSGPLSGHTHD